MQPRASNLDATPRIKLVGGFTGLPADAYAAGARRLAKSHQLNLALPPLPLVEHDHDSPPLSRARAAPSSESNMRKHNDELTVQETDDPACQCRRKKTS